MVAKEGDPDQKLLYDFLDTMQGESDRGCLLVGLSAIDESLGRAIRIILSRNNSATDADWLLDPKPGGRPLASLAIRTRMAKCLGVIGPEVRCVIDALRRLRNTHAHGTAPFVLTKEDSFSVFKEWSDEQQRAIRSIFCFQSDGENDARSELLESVAWIQAKLHVKTAILEKRIDIEILKGLPRDDIADEPRIGG